MYDKKVALELGSSDPLVISNSINPIKASKVIFENWLMNLGQVCSSPKWIYIHNDIY